jgi:thiol-disulfide isomerase/thioredoxin
MPADESATPVVNDSPRPSSASPLVFALVLTAIAAALVLLVWRKRGGSDAADHPAVGQRLALVQLAPLTGDATAIDTEQLQGRVTLINFWGPWCEFCLREMPHFVRMRKALSDRGDVQFLFVSCTPDWQPNTPPALGWREDLPPLRDSTAALLAQREWNIPTWSDPQGKTRQAFAGFDGWQGYPTTLIVDRTGVIRFVSIGYTAGDEREIEEQLRTVLGERGT